MKRNKKLLWQIGIPLLIAGIAAVIAFRDTILLYAAPKTVLTGALTSLYTQLDNRFSDGPLSILIKTYDPQGCYTAQLQAKATNALMGDIYYDMTVQTDGAAHRLYAEGTAGTQDSALDLSVYMDGDFLAVSSQDLAKGGWYGITYNSFPTDIRSIPLLQYVISDSLVNQWNASLRRIQAGMLENDTGPEIPELSEEDLQAFLAGLLLLPGKVSADKVRLDGIWTDCRRIDYSADSNQLPELFRQDNTSVAASFYLCENTLVRVDFYYTADADRVNGEVFLGMDPSKDMLSLELKQTKNGVFSSLLVSVQTQNAEGEYTESWTIEKDGVLTGIRYAWKAVSGDMTLSVNEAAPAALNLTATESGLRIYSEDCAALTSNLTQEETPSAPERLTMTIQRGSEVETPPYKNLDQWSLEDFWQLLEGIGALFGLRVN